MDGGCGVGERSLAGWVYVGIHKAFVKVMPWDRGIVTSKNLASDNAIFVLDHQFSIPLCLQTIEPCKPGTKFHCRDETKEKVHQIPESFDQLHEPMPIKRWCLDIRVNHSRYTYYQ